MPHHSGVLPHPREAAAPPTELATQATATPHAALQLAMRIGDVLLSAGMSANDVVVAMLRVTDAYGLSGVHVDVTYTSISASYYPGPGLAPVTSIRIVKPSVPDYTRVQIGRAHV